MEQERRLMDEDEDDLDDENKLHMIDEEDDNLSDKDKSQP